MFSPVLLTQILFLLRIFGNPVVFLLWPINFRVCQPLGVFVFLSLPTWLPSCQQGLPTFGKKKNIVSNNLFFCVHVSTHVKINSDNKQLPLRPPPPCEYIQKSVLKKRDTGKRGRSQKKQVWRESLSNKRLSCHIFFGGEGGHPRISLSLSLFTCVL